MNRFTTHLKSVGAATLANLTGRIANVVIPLAVIAVYGANRSTDHFFFILSLSFFFYGTVANALTETTVPLMISGRLRLKRSTIVKMGVMVSFAVFAMALAWVRIQHNLSWSYAMALGLLSGAGIVNGLATGVRYARESYMLPGTTWAIRFVPLGLFIAAKPSQNELFWLALGIGAADWMRSVILLASPDFSDGNKVSYDWQALKNTLSAYGTVIAATLIMGLNPIIDRIIANLAGPGGITLIETGERIYGMPAGLATMGLMTVLLTKLSQKATSADFHTLWPSVLKMIALWTIAWSAIGLIAGLWGLPWWLRRFTVFTTAEADIATSIYWYYLAGLPSFIFGVAYVKRLQAMSSFKILVITAVTAVVLNIPASLLLNKWMGVPGIALATSLIYTLNLVILIMIGRRFSKAAGEF